MHRNTVWLAFLAIFSLITLWYAGDAVYKIYSYDRLSMKTSPSTLDLEVVDNGSGRYYYVGNYSITVNDEVYKGREQLKQPIFRNRAAAVALMPEYRNDPWTVWYSPQNPLHSTLQKSYPFKELTYGLGLIALLCYFLWLGFKVADQSRLGR